MHTVDHSHSSPPLVSRTSSFFLLIGSLLLLLPPIACIYLSDLYRPEPLVYAHNKSMREAFGNTLVAVLGTRSLSANVANPNYEEGTCLEEEVYEVMVLPKGQVVASTEEDVGSCPELQQVQSEENFR